MRRVCFLYSVRYTKWEQAGEGAQSKVEGLVLRRTRIELLGSDHGTIWSLHLEELDDEGGAPCDNLGRQVAEGTVLDAHDGQLAAEGQLKWEAVQVGVVIEVQLLQVLQCA